MGHAKEGTAKNRRAPGRAKDLGQLDAWTQSTLEAGHARPTAEDPVRDLLEKNLVRIAQELAMRAGKHGVTVCDIRIHAEQRGLLTGEERGRQLSWLCLIPRKAGLKSTGQVRPSTRPRAHGNFQRTWVLPAFAVQLQGAAQ
jgi:hypothetical protein